MSERLSAFEAYDLTNPGFLSSISIWDGKVESFFSCLDAIKSKLIKIPETEYIYLIFMTAGAVDKFVASEKFSDHFNPITQFEMVQKGFIGYLYNCAVYTDTYTSRIKFIKNDVEIYAIEKP